MTQFSYVHPIWFYDLKLGSRRSYGVVVAEDEAVADYMASSLIRMCSYSYIIHWPGYMSFQKCLLILCSLWYPDFEPIDFHSYSSLNHSLCNYVILLSYGCIYVIPAFHYLLPVSHTLSKILERRFDYNFKCCPLQL